MKTPEKWVDDGELSCIKSSGRLFALSMFQDTPQALAAIVDYFNNTRHIIKYEHTVSKCAETFLAFPSENPNKKNKEKHAKHNGYLTFGASASFPGWCCQRAPSFDTPRCDRWQMHKPSDDFNCCSMSTVRSKPGTWTNRHVWIFMMLWIIDSKQIAIIFDHICFKWRLTEIWNARDESNSSVAVGWSANIRNMELGCSGNWKLRYAATHQNLKP